MLRPLHDPSRGPLRVVALMSGSGTNLEAVLRRQRALEAERGASPYEIVAIFSDAFDSAAPRIGRDFDLPVVLRDIRAFYARRGLDRRDLSLRPCFDRIVVEALAPYGATCALYAGYMSVASEVLIDAFLGVNVHPADLSILDVEGRRRFTGDHAVRDAILAGEKTLRSTTHLVEPVVDGGRLLMISPSVDVDIPAGFDPADKPALKQLAREHQQRLKESGDWRVLPATLQRLAEGRFAQDEAGALYFDGAAIPGGVRTDEG